MPEVREISVSAERSITTGQNSTFDKQRIFCSLTATLQDGENEAAALAQLSATANIHLDKQLSLMATAPTKAVQEVVAVKQAAITPQEAPVQQQRFQKKPVLGNCGNCGAGITNAKTMEFAAKYNKPPLCYSCYQQRQATTS